MQDLIERLEKATGPDRELDAEIWMTLNPTWRAFERTQVGGWETLYGKTQPASEYTGSIDAALTLMPSDWGWALFLEGGEYRVEAGDPMLRIDISHVLAAPALCIAALKARAEAP